jgi:hypothetical protein
MLTTELADQRVGTMSDTELERTIDQQFSADPDQRLLVIRAVMERGRRAEAAAGAARLAAPVEAARSAARTAWEQAGSPGDFDTFFAQRQRQEANEQLDNQRFAARYRMQRSF